jgi:hypothetical protein
MSSDSPNDQTAVVNNNDGELQISGDDGSVNLAYNRSGRVAGNEADISKDVTPPPAQSERRVSARLSQRKKVPDIVLPVRSPRTPPGRPLMDMPGINNFFDGDEEWGNGKKLGKTDEETDPLGLQDGGTMMTCQTSEQGAAAAAAEGDVFENVPQKQVEKKKKTLGRLARRRPAEKVAEEVQTIAQADVFEVPSSQPMKKQMETNENCRGLNKKKEPKSIAEVDDHTPFSVDQMLSVSNIRPDSPPCPAELEEADESIFTIEFYKKQLKRAGDKIRRLQKSQSEIMKEKMELDLECKSLKGRLARIVSHAEENLELSKTKWRVNDMSDYEKLDRKIRVQDIEDIGVSSDEFEDPYLWTDKWNEPFEPKNTASNLEYRDGFVLPMANKNYAEFEIGTHFAEFHENLVRIKYSPINNCSPIHTFILFLFRVT